MARIICFDTETTGLDPEEDHIIEFGAIVYDDKGEELDQFNTLLWTPKRIPDEAYRVHGISKRQLDLSGKQWDKVGPEIAQMVASADFWCGQNIEFDIDFLAAALRRIDIKLENKPYLDTLKVARRFLPDLPKYKLANICEFIKVPLDQAHRAVHDARATAKAAFKLAEELELTFEELVANNIICMGKYAIGLDPFEAQVKGMR